VPPLGNIARRKARRVGESELEHLRIEVRNGRVVEHQHVVCLDIEPAEREVRRSGEHLERLAIALCDENLVVLQVPEMRARHILVAAGRLY
jgi:hypothetical protein